MRPIQILAAFCAVATVAACALEPDTVSDPETDELDELVGEDFDDDGVVEPGGSDPGELPPPIALPPGIEGAPSAADRTVASGRDEQIAACTSTCDGVYQRHGALPYEWCLCRTSDAGERCESGSDCAGDCLFVGLEAEAGGMATPYGECAEFEQVFGCYAYLPETAEGPVEVESYSPPAICID